MEKRLKDVLPILEKNEQMHLINFYNELDEEQKKSLINQIKNTDFDFINKLYIDSFKNTIVDYRNIMPLEYYSKLNMEEAEVKRFTKIGEQIIKDGKVAVLTLAGRMWK